LIMMKVAGSICIASFLVLAFLIPGTIASENDTLFQTTTISALTQGVYDGTMTFKDLGAHGDFGIGTVQALDGEMIGLDGEFYQVKSNGIAYRVSDSMKTPFAEVAFFEPEGTIALNGTSNLTGLERRLDGSLVSKNLFYGIRIEGLFDYVKTRSVPMQSKPYPPLSEAVKAQKIFEFHNIKGTIVGFRCPDYIQGVNVPGYHLHFITLDRSAGGHLLDFSLKNASVSIDSLSSLNLALPENEEFYQADLSENPQATLAKVESNPKN
jgi:acetolactate decarboxylase